MLVYSVVDLPGERQVMLPNGEPSKPRAVHVPPNAPRGVPIETSGFVGSALWLQVPAGSDASPQGRGGGHPYRQHFEGRRRLWEFRIQGRFRRVPNGELFMGIVLRDFNYGQAVAPYSLAVKRLGLMLIKWQFYLSWGDRCEAAQNVDAELSHLVTPVTAFDQIIVTPAGETPPPISADLTGLGMDRKSMGYEKYKVEVEGTLQALNTNDTYTFCFWGPSPFIDLLQWQFRFGTTISIAQFLEEWPLHFVMYELDQAGTGGSTAARKHFESDKRYFLDVMMWSTQVKCSELSKRYIFLDAPEGLEEATAELAAKAALEHLVARRTALAQAAHNTRQTARAELGSPSAASSTSTGVDDAASPLSPQLVGKPLQALFRRLSSQQSAGTATGTATSTPGVGTSCNIEGVRRAASSSSSTREDSDDGGTWSEAGAT